MDIVILAGGKASEETRAETGVEYRCQLPWRDGTMLDHVRRAAEAVGSVVVVGGPPESRDVEAGSDFVGSVTAGLKATNGAEVLIVTADLPFLREESLLAFAAQCDADAALNFAVVPLDVCRQEFPMLKRTAIVTKQGRLTGGNVCLCRREMLLANMEIVAQAYAKRKSPLALAGMVGPLFILRFVLGQALPSLVSLQFLENRVSRILKFKARAVVCPFADIGTDVDNLEQYKAVLPLQERASPAE